MSNSSLFYTYSTLFIIAVVGCGPGKPPGGDGEEPANPGAADSADTDASTPTDSADDVDAGEPGADSLTDGNEPTTTDGGSVVSDEPAGEADSFEFEEKYNMNPDAMIGQTWRVKGFMNNEKNVFRKESWDNSKVHVEFANPPAASEMHSCRELTIRGVVQKNAQGQAVLQQAVIDEMGPHPVSHVFTPDEMIALFAANPAYAALQFNNGDYQNPLRFSIRGRVFDINHTINAVYFLATENRVVAIQLSREYREAEGLKHIERGADMVLQAKWGGRQNKDDRTVVRVEDARPVEEQPESPRDTKAVPRMTAFELHELATTNIEAFYEKHLIADLKGKGQLPNEAGYGGEFLLTPFIVSGTIKKTSAFPDNPVLTDSVFLSLGDAKPLQCMLTKDQSVEGLKVGDEISIIGSYTYFGLQGENAFSITSGRIWREE